MDFRQIPERDHKKCEQEATILKQLSHRNIISFIESFKNKKGQLCIVMDHADAGDLDSLIKIHDNKKEPIKEDQILGCFTQICEGIKHVHSNHIIHRDLKPQNIFLTKSGTVKIGDFGISAVQNYTN